jgi:hypothetical protein
MERQAYGGLSEAEIDAIAEKAAERALAKVYGEVGKSVVKGFLWVVGSISLAVVAWARGKGLI